eukprot:5698687-Pyramimonas_sp.AAC.1
MGSTLTGQRTPAQAHKPHLDAAQGEAAQGRPEDLVTRHWTYRGRHRHAARGWQGSHGDKLLAEDGWRALGGMEAPT